MSWELDVGALLMGIYVPIIVMAVGSWAVLVWRAILPELREGSFDWVRHALGIGAVLLLTADALENLWYGSARWAGEHSRLIDVLPPVGAMKLLILIGCVFVWTAALHGRIRRPLLVSASLACSLWAAGIGAYMLWW